VTRSRSITRLLAVVPARNEEALIERCLSALVASASALARVRPEIVVDLVVVPDACVDGTDRLCRLVPGVTVIASDVGRVGAARALGVESVLAQVLHEDLEQIWLANTDADSVVPENWLEHQVALAEGGADVVIGTVRPDPADLTDAQWQHWRATHTPGAPNGHVHGANLGLRASVYRQVGGFEPLDEHEDNQLVARIRETGAVVVAADEAEVVTSGRFVGRTPGGYAKYLEVTL
jgi:glycosyltransferase involved in cell wall biosynthesis